MLEHDRGAYLVPMLTACPRATGEVFVQVAWINVNFVRLRLAQDGNGHGARLNSTSFLGRRDSLPSVAAAFMRERGTCFFADDAEEQEPRAFN